MTGVEISARESIFILDGGADAELPAGSGGPVLAGPQAIFVAGRVAPDAPTIVRIGSRRDQGELVAAYAGHLATPDRLLRLLNVGGDVLAQVPVDCQVTPIEIYVSDLDEPDEISVALGGAVSDDRHSRASCGSEAEKLRCARPYGVPGASLVSWRGLPSGVARR